MAGNSAAENGGVDDEEEYGEAPLRPLSAREIRFVQLYFETGNKTRSYLNAKFPKKVSENATTVAAITLLRKPNVAKYLDELRQAAADAAMVTVEELAQGFRRGSRADISLMIGEDGFLLPPNKWPDEFRLAVVRVEVEELFEWEADESGKRKKRLKGQKWKVWMENKTECRKVLAQWKKMVGTDATPPQQGPGNSIVIETGPENIDPPTEEKDG